MRLPPERLALALMQNLEIWIEDMMKIADMPGDHQRQALHLTRNMLQCQIALKRMTGQRIEE